MIVDDATHQRVQVSGEGSVHSGESVRVTNNDVTGLGRSISLASKERVASPTQEVGIRVMLVMRQHFFEEVGDLSGRFWTERLQSWAW